MRLGKSQKYVFKNYKREILYFEKKKEKQKVEGLSKITLSNTKKMNKYYEEKLKKQRKIFEKREIEEDFSRS